jgi:hypothetical protein
VSGWRAIALDDVEAVPWRDTDLVWRPVRGAIGTRIAGMAAYTAERVGQDVVEAHAETPDGRGHEEVYVVLRGRATFTLDGEWVDRARPYFESDPARAAAILDELEAFRPGSPGLRLGRALLAHAQGDLDTARAQLREALELEPRIIEWEGEDPELDALGAEL